MTINSFKCEIKRIDKDAKCMDAVYTYDDGTQKFIGVFCPDSVADLPMTIAAFSGLPNWECFFTSNELRQEADYEMTFVFQEPVYEPPLVDQEFFLEVTEL